MSDKLDEIAGAYRCRAAVGRAYDLGCTEERKRCADIADRSMQGVGLTNAEREIATTIRNLILLDALATDPSPGTGTASPERTPAAATGAVTGVAPESPASKPTQVIDLMQALKDSLKARCHPAPEPPALRGEGEK